MSTKRARRSSSEKSEMVTPCAVSSCLAKGRCPGSFERFAEPRLQREAPASMATGRHESSRIMEGIRPQDYSTSFDVGYMESQNMISGSDSPRRGRPAVARQLVIRQTWD